MPKDCHNEISENHNEMGLIKEPKNVNFSVQSEPWTEEELKEFRELMNKLKEKNVKRKLPFSPGKKNGRT